MQHRKDDFVAAVDEQILTCDICFEKYSNQGLKLPKLLSCFHSFCYGCLVELANSLGTSAICCPTCRATTEFQPSGDGLGSLQSNFWILNVLDIIEKYSSSTQPLKSVIDVDSKDIVPECVCRLCSCAIFETNCVGCCEKCNGSICTSCSFLHERGPAFKDHVIVPVVEFDATMSTLSNGQDKICKKHSSKNIQFCCVDCCEVACIICIECNHLGHNLLSLLEGKIHQLGPDPSMVGAVGRDTVTCSAKVQSKFEREFGTKSTEVSAASTSCYSVRGCQVDSVVDISSIVTILGTGQGADEVQLHKPQGIEIVIDRDDRCYFVTVDSNNRVHVFDAESGRFLRSFGGGYGTASNQFKLPIGIAVGDSNDGQTLIYVSDSGNHRVQVYDFVSGSFVHSIGNGCGESLGQMNTPYGIALSRSPAEALLYVVDRHNNRIQVFDVDSGQCVRIIGADERSDGPVGEASIRGIGVRAGEASIRGIGVGAGEASMKGVGAGAGEASIRGIGVRAGEASMKGVGAGAGALSQPRYLTLRSTSPPLLYVSEMSKHCIQVFDVGSGLVVRTIGTVQGVQPGQMSFPAGMALRMPPPGSTSPPLLYVCEQGNHRIQVFDADTGAHVRFLGAGYGISQGRLSEPFAIKVCSTVSGSTLVAVTEYGNHRIQVLLDDCV